ncbi:hypothetical protein L9F63_009956 [Diploptera punctata]|uniref:C2H2-type domain-containing protein n=1 Tax=Diploptera punctata TaxID=6984 RepID=A0AAD8AKU6_DIPPU|nr:hypothetical protein L9F63_009956 [Diploptera punctata]
MNSVSEHEDFDTHDVALAITEIKVEPLITECEIKPETVEYQDVTVDKKLLSCDSTPRSFAMKDVEHEEKMRDEQHVDSVEHTVIKTEIEPICELQELEVDESKEDINKWVKDYEDKTETKQDKQEYYSLIEGDKIPDTCRTGLQNEDYNGCLLNSTGNYMNVNYMAHYSNFEYTNLSIDSQIEDGLICKECNKPIYRSNFSENKFIDREEVLFCNCCNPSPAQSTSKKKKSLICDFCFKLFSNRYNLNSHIRIHTNEKPFKCELCSKSFADRSNLVSHKRTHTNEKPYTCNICGRPFSDKTNLTVHIRTHTKERPFLCHFCNKSFTRKSILDTHKSKTFGQKHGLTSHLRKHTKEKPYTCNICTKSFSHRQNLIKHITNIHK